MLRGRRTDKSKFAERHEPVRRQLQFLFSKGLSVHSFVAMFPELVGETAAASANAIVRLECRLESACRAWLHDIPDKCGYTCRGADATYSEPGGEREETVLLRLAVSR